MATFNFGDLYDITAATVPDKVAIRYDGTSITFAESAARTDRIAAALHAAGVRRGDTVALHLHNVPAHSDAFIAACKLGATMVPNARIAMFLPDRRISPLPNGKLVNSFSVATPVPAPRG